MHLPAPWAELPVEEFAWMRRPKTVINSETEIKDVPH